MDATAGVDDDSVTPLVRRTTAWAWRLLVLLAAVVAVSWVIAQLKVIVVPVLIATMVTALLLPAVDRLDKHRVPRGAAVAMIMVAGLALLGGLLSFVVGQFIKGLPDLSEQVSRSIESTKTWLIEGPLDLSIDQIDTAGTSAVEALRNNQDKLTSGALSTAATLTELVTGTLLVLFTLIFFLYGGRGIWEFVVKLFPAEARERVSDAGRAGFGSLVGFVRATFIVALVDAIGIGVGLAIMSVPLALPLASLVFLGAFVPVVGAVVTGFLAVIVALLTKGMVYGLATLALILAVQQLESHVLQPVLMGRATSIHPLAVVLGIAAGTVQAGILGALLAVPVIAFLNSAIRVLVSKDPDAEEAEILSEDGPLIKADADGPGEEP